MSKREAEDDLLPIATLGDVAKETRFEPLRKLLEPVKEARVAELSEELRVALKKRGEEKATKLLLEAFFAACDALSKAASSKRPNVTSDESTPGENQLFFVLFLLFFYLSLLQRSLTCQHLTRCWRGSRAWPCSMALPCVRTPLIRDRALPTKTLGTKCVGIEVKWCDTR